ncbi:MAG: hypothetical protein ACYTFK_08455 [Planctomycetota bacterium]
MEQLTCAKRQVTSCFTVVVLFLGGCQSGSLWAPMPAEGVSPIDELPVYTRQVTHFGQRADWSHDGRRILFIEKTFGDVRETQNCRREIARRKIL